MNNQSEPIDVTSTAVAVRDNQPTQGGMQRYDARDRALAIESILNRQATVNEVMAQVMKPDVHYGTIPGTNDKKVLLKAGAEKLSAVFRLTPQFTVHQTDYQNYHREYRVTCRLSDGTEGVGTCATLEEKYRYRKGSRKCPKCGKETIIEGKPEYGGGWLCWGKKGGCGAKFEIADPTIISQKTEKVEHSNPADYWNTCLKMAKKRAHVDAIITATATSDLLTQDVGDVEEMSDAADNASARVDGAATQAPTQPEQKKEPPKKASTAPRAKKEEKKADAPQTMLPDAEAKRLFKWLDACQAAFVCKMENDGVMLPFAWAWAVKYGLILPNETLSAVQATKLFPGVNLNANVEGNKQGVADDFRKNVIAIETMGKDGPLDAETMKGYRTAYKEPAPEGETPSAPEPEKKVEVPRDRDVSWKAIAVPSWSKHFKEGAKTFGDLKKNQLWWWVIKWQPEGFQGKPPKDEDIKLRNILDTVKEQYDFESDDAGSEPASRTPEPEPASQRFQKDTGQAPIPDDDIPF